MSYRLLADLIVTAHLLFVLFVVGGGLLALRWPRVAWLHLLKGTAMRRLPPDSERPSRTQRKLAAEAVVELAHQLAALPDPAFKGLPLPSELRDEFQQVRAMKASAARARQLRHLAGELRADDDLLAAVNKAVGGQRRLSREEALRFQQREELRESLLDPHHGAEVLSALEQSAPGLDHAALHEQIERYRQTGDKRYYRAIFRLLEQAGLP